MIVFPPCFVNNIDMRDACDKRKFHIVLTIIVFALSIAMNAFIIVQSCLYSAMSTSSSGLAVNILKAIINAFHNNAINEDNIGTFTYVIRKLIGHFGFFTISGLLTSWAIYLLSYYLKKYKHYMGIIFSLCFGLFLAGLTELIQSFIPDRSGQISDVLIDFGGYILGMGIIILIVFILLHHQRNKENEKVQ